MLNRDQYHRAADEICFQLVSKPAEVFNHKVNQDREHKSDELIQVRAGPLPPQSRHGEISVIFHYRSRAKPKAAFGERFLGGSWRPSRRTAGPPATAGGRSTEYSYTYAP